MTITAQGLIRKPIINFLGTHAVNKITTLRLDRGPEYHKILLRLLNGGTPLTKAQIIADIKEIVINLGNGEIWRVAGNRLIAMLEYYQSGSVSNGDDGILPLYFSRHWMEAVGVEGGVFGNIDGPALGTDGEPVIGLEIHWAAAITSDTLTGVSYIGPKAAPLGTHVTLLEIDAETASTGWKKVMNIEPDQLTSIIAMHIENDDISEVRFEVDGHKPFDIEVAYLHREVLDAGRTPQTGFTHIDFALRNRFSDVLALEGVTSDIILSLKFDVAPGAFDILIERAEGPGAGQPTLVAA